MASYPVPGYPHLATARPQGTAAQLGSGRIDVQDIRPGLLAILERVGAMLGKTITIFSGYRTSAYSAKVGGFAGDPHSRGIAVDATVGGKPLGAAVPGTTWASLGITSGATPDFYLGKSDPTHVQLRSGDQLGAPAVSAASQFVDAVLHAIGAPLTSTNRALLNAWMSAEGTKAKNNPLATTQSATGATNFNSTGVKNYPTFAVGVAATAKTLTNGRYPGIVSSLRAGNVAPNAIVNRYALEFNTWGTGASAVISRLKSGGGSFLGGVWSGVSGIPGTINKIDPLNPYGALGAIGFGTGGLSSIQDFYNLAGNLLSRDFWLRMLEIGAGGVLVMSGLWLLAKQIGLPAPSAGDVGLAVATKGAA